MIHFFDAQTDKLLGYLDGGEVKNFTGDLVEEGVDGTAIFDFRIPGQIPEAVGVAERVRILVPHERIGYREFICYDSDEIKRQKTIKAVGSEIELDKLKIVLPNRYEAYTLRQMMEVGVDGIDWQIGNVVGGQLLTLEYESYMGGYEFLQRVAGRYGVELVFRVEIEGKRIVGRYIDAVSRRGQRDGKEFVNKKDLIGVRKTVHTQRFVTALWVIMPDDEDGNARDPVLVTDPDAFQRWNRKGQHLYGYHTITSEDGAMTVERARELGTTELKKRIASSVEYEIEALDLSPTLPHEAAYLGDYVTIKDDDFNPPLFASARIINVKRPIQRKEQKRPVKKTYIIGEVEPYSTEEMNDALQRMQERFEKMIAEAERKAIEAGEYAGGILSSAELAALLAAKADEETLSHYVTQGELSELDNETTARILEAIQNLDLSDFPTRDELDQIIEEVEEKAKEVVNPNLIRNSIGYGEFAYWDVTSANTDIATVRTETLLRLKFGSGFYFPVSSGERVLEQTINVEANKAHAFSWFLERQAAGAITIQILENDSVVLTVPDFADPIFSFRSSYVPFTPSNNQIKIRITVAATVEATFTGAMLAEGVTPVPWGLAQGELYNAYVQIDDFGITVLRLDANGQIEGSTKITPEEFAGFFDENGTGNPEKIFWFNRDETYTKKLVATHEITLGQIKMVPIDSATNKGIAFVAVVPE